jgi:hypothetical protein
VRSGSAAAASPVLCALVLCVSCARAGEPGAPAGGRVAAARADGPLNAADFQREIAPFPVLDASGQPYEFPFLGGLNQPRPQFVDIDDDGDNDLFIHELGSSLQFFENTGSAGEPRFEWRTDRYQDLDVGEWARFADIDSDGDVDLVAELPYGRVRLIRNTGSARQANFVAESDSLRDAAGVPLYIDRQNIPAFGDIDCNGRLDLLVGRVEGVATRYEAVSPRDERFAFVTDYFEGIEIIGQTPPGIEGVETIGQTPWGTSRHGANALQLVDADGDGDTDLLWGDFFEPGVLLIENRGASCAAFSFSTSPVPVPTADSLETSGYNVPAAADVDGDGDLDFVMGVLGGAYSPVRNLTDNLYYWERTADDRLAFRTGRLLYGIDAGAESASAFGDLDGDGDLDLLVGTRIDPARSSTASLLYFRNDGTPGSPSFSLADTVVLDPAYHYAPALGDLDNDGDLDLMLGTWNRDVAFYRNTGSRTSPRFERDTTVSLDIERAGNATPVLVDFDGDGDLDLLVGEATGELTLVRNEGTPREPRFVRVTDRLGDIDVGRRSAPAVVDLDGDGLLDLVIGRETAGIAAFRNAGSATEPLYEPWPFEIPLPANATPVFVDLDGDGRLDLVAGGIGGGLVFYRNTR